MSEHGEFPLIEYKREVKTPKGCKRCGSKTVAWKVNKAGKWYLVEVFDFDGDDRSHFRDFHSNYCGRDWMHTQRQNEINETLGQKRRDDAQISKARADKTAAENARVFLALHDLCKSDPFEARQEIADRERKIEIESRGLTMDYMVEFSQSVAKIERWRAEIAFMRAALGDVSYEEEEVAQ